MVSERVVPVFSLTKNGFKEVISVSSIEESVFKFQKVNISNDRVISEDVVSLYLRSYPAFECMRWMRGVR